MNAVDKTTKSDHSNSDLGLVHASPLRPPMDYSSCTAFFKSISARWKSIWTKQFVLSLLYGQILSVCIACTSAATTELVDRGLSLPTMQNNFLYLLLFATYTPYTMFKYGLKGWVELVKRDGWKYFILAACDVEANFLVVKAFSYTDLLSCMLLDAWAIPICLFFSWVYMRVKYHWTQILSVMICIVGQGLLVTSDILTGKNWAGPNKGIGDALLIAGATLYGFTNATEEFLARKRPLYEVIGQLGMFGFIINGIQASALEYDLVKNGNWNGTTAGLLLAYTSAMLILYTLAPILFRLSSSAYFNLSSLSRSFYGLLFGLLLFRSKPYWLYFVSQVIVVIGLVAYFWSSAPEEQGIVDSQTPGYIVMESGNVNKAKNVCEETVLSGTEACSV
ncbi:DUF914 domain containing protein [Amanita muscaria]